MENRKDLKREGFHDYNKESAEGYAEWNGKTFSVNIFQWIMKSGKKEMKPSKCVVRVSGKPEDKEKVFDMCDTICKLLDAREWDGRKTVFIK